MTRGYEPVNAIFGTSDEPIAYVEFEGLTKREYFAGLAMQGLAARGAYIPTVNAAEAAVKMADALIEALNKDV